MVTLGASVSAALKNIGIDWAKTKKALGKDKVELVAQEALASFTLAATPQIKAQYEDSGEEFDEGLVNASIEKSWKKYLRPGKEQQEQISLQTAKIFQDAIENRLKLGEYIVAPGSKAPKADTKKKAAKSKTQKKLADEEEEVDEEEADEEAEEEEEEEEAVEEEEVEEEDKAPKGATNVKKEAKERHKKDVEDLISKRDNADSKVKELKKQLKAAEKISNDTNRKLATLQGKSKKPVTITDVKKEAKAAVDARASKLTERINKLEKTLLAKMAAKFKEHDAALDKRYAKGARSKSANRDPNAPKKSEGPFIIFTREYREKAKKHPKWAEEMHLMETEKKTVPVMSDDGKAKKVEGKVVTTRVETEAGKKGKKVLLRPTDMQKALGKIWRDWGEGSTKRKPYKIKAAHKKKEYEQQLEKYRAEKAKKASAEADE